MLPTKSECCIGRQQSNVDHVDSNADETKPSDHEWFGASNKRRLVPIASVPDHVVQPDLVIQVDTNPVRHSTAVELTNKDHHHDTDRNISPEGRQDTQDMRQVRG